MQYIHVINDEKFVDRLIVNYETLYPNQNRFFIITYSSKLNFRFVKETDKTELVFYKLIFQFIDNAIENESLLFIHGLDRLKLKIINRYKGNLKIGVHFWGADIYLLPKFTNRLYLRKTKKLLIKRESCYSALTTNLRGFYYHWRYKKILKYVSLYSTVVEAEKKFISEYLPNASYVNFNYADIEGLGLQNFIINKCATKILIGNSSSYTNNHLDLFDKLGDIVALQGIEKIVPLNYGDNNYATDVINYIHKRKLKNYITLVNFLPFDQYLKILAQCSIAVMGHQRQQAVGNIIICIWLGMRVFLSKVNPVYKDYKRRGMIVFSIEEDLTDVQTTSLLDTKQIQNNRIIIESLYSKDKTFSNIKYLINLMDEKHQ